MGPMTNDNDSLLAEKLRREDPEQYHTLIRMHLSFLLDLNTDECDSASDKVKSRILKWNLLPFSKKSKAQSKGVMEGAPLTQEGICQVYQLIEYLSKEQSIQQEGIFRRSGKLKRQQELKALLNQGITLDLNAGHFSVHDCASVLKNFLAELPEPLLTDAHYPAHYQIAEMCASSADGKSDGRLLTALQLLLLLLPAENRVLLSDLVSLLHLTASYQRVNRMSAESLATLFTPHLACPRKMPPEALHANSQLMSHVIAFMIRQGATSLFSIPPQLATDIRAYWARKESNESEPSKKVEVSCGLKGERRVGEESAEVNTVFSFVDRERTAQAHHSNPTEAALAQLYAHIRSLPESSEKRRLVKQFNKENGLGTPHQHNARIINPRGRSLGDSIKKHLFNKGIKCAKNGVHQGHFNVLQQASSDKSNSPDGAPTPKLMMFQRSRDELSPLPKPSSHFSTQSSSSSEEMVTQMSQRKLRFSDSVSSEKSSGNHESSDQIGTNDEQSPCGLQCIDPMHSSVTSHHKNSDGTPSEIRISSGGIRPSLLSNSGRKSVPKTVQSQDHSNAISCTPTGDNVLSPMHQCAERYNWLPGSNLSPLSYQNALDKKLKYPSSELRSLVTSTPANHFPRRSTRLRTRSSMETSLLCHQNSLLLTPATSEENSSMSPLTKSTQKMSKAMQESMMTPRSRKPVLALSGSNISHFPSMVHCMQKRNEEKSINYNVTCIDGNPKDGTPVGKKSICVSSELVPKEEKVKAEPHSASDNEPEIMSKELLNTDSGSLTSTFVNYLQSRSILTASPIDLSIKDEDSDEAIDFHSLNSGNLSESLLYCLDGNVPSPNESSSSSDKGKVSISPSSGKYHLRPRKRASAEAVKDGSDEDQSSRKKLFSDPQQVCHQIEYTPERPKNQHVFETSL
ncbi:uncharacterized protein LOC124155638 isoform X2 [Ischnura elegans]|uniref:uncharacterized protein LOC124155638 isoform X2 n=1 Tax=Ischnura elegans TaxID=197161 RepID=UPI001ED8AB6C|nr:uncharacterized protein LOC124155638 isoform X2 [Ischnura elegans]